MVGKTQNPKGLALFLTALLKLRKLDLLEDENLPRDLLAQIVASRSLDPEYWSWGYSFPWQTRTILVPRGAPNLVCTIFVANALLDTFEALADEACLDMAISAGNYLLEKLYYTEARWSRGFRLSFADFQVEGAQREFPCGGALESTLSPHRRRAAA